MIIPVSLKAHPSLVARHGRLPLTGAHLVVTPSQFKMRMLAVELVGIQHHVAHPVIWVLLRNLLQIVLFLLRNLEIVVFRKQLINEVRCLEAHHGDEDHSIGFEASDVEVFGRASAHVRRHRKDVVGKLIVRVVKSTDRQLAFNLILNQFDLLMIHVVRRIRAVRVRQHWIRHCLAILTPFHLLLWLVGLLDDVAVLLVLKMLKVVLPVLLVMVLRCVCSSRRAS